nr:hypothetical protein [Kibdelosporangium sp. MJ126-NF4]
MSRRLSRRGDVLPKNENLMALLRLRVQAARVAHWCAGKPGRRCSCCPLIRRNDDSGVFNARVGQRRGTG